MEKKNLILSVNFETVNIADVSSMLFPIRILDHSVIYRCDNLSQFNEWLDDKEGALQARITEFDRVIEVREVEDVNNAEK
jgi:hypothetical protein